jgi:hypothetical protein
MSIFLWTVPLIEILDPQRTPAEIFGFYKEIRRRKYEPNKLENSCHIQAHSTHCSTRNKGQLGLGMGEYPDKR